MEQELLSEEVQVKCRYTNNGVYTPSEFVKKPATKGTGLFLSGVGAHPQNGGAEASSKEIVFKY